MQMTVRAVHALQRAEREGLTVSLVRNPRQGIPGVTAADRRDGSE